MIIYWTDNKVIEKEIYTIFFYSLTHMEGDKRTT